MVREERKKEGEWQIFIFLDKPEYVSVYKECHLRMPNWLERLTLC